MTELPQRKQLVQVRRARLGFELVSFVISFLELFPEGWTANLAALPRSLWAGDPLEYRQSDQRSELVPSLSTVCVCVCMRVLKPEVNARCLSHSLLIKFFETEPLPEPGVHCFR